MLACMRVFALPLLAGLLLSSSLVARSNELYAPQSQSQAQGLAQQSEGRPATAAWSARPETAAWSARHDNTLEQALLAAGGNRAELEQALEHYAIPGNELKLRAVEFLIKNMDRQGYAPMAFFNAAGQQADFHALDHINLTLAQQAYNLAEKELGTLQYKPTRFDADLQSITANYLIQNVDLAFAAWEEKPWARKMSFEAFCESILPYRGSNEPLENWREACMARYADLDQAMTDASDLAEAAELIQADVARWVRFSDLYYLHPTDQGFAEMNQTGLGRCEDITNMTLYALRANAVPVAGDYTPAWANRDNNHAWTVVLDADGRGRASLSNIAAKIYRKTFAIQPDAWSERSAEGESVPRWLAGRNYIDVTEQYMPVQNVEIPLTETAPEGVSLAYLCVFNGGEWTAIHAGEISNDRAHFTDMGRGIAYLPAYFDGQNLIPAAPAFVLDTDGRRTELGGVNYEEPGELVAMTTTKPKTGDDDTRIDIPALAVRAGTTYEMFYWDGQWQSLGRRTAGDRPLSFELPSNRLYWLVADGPRHLERIFTLEIGSQRWW
jgi:hypothetical protein